MKQSTSRQRVYSGIAVMLAGVLALPAGVMAQSQPAPAAANAAPPPGAQRLRVLPMSNNDMNDLQTKVMAPLAVQILDQNDIPVEGATVIFRFPLSGPSGAFADGQTAQTIRTPANGQARANGWLANGQPGTFSVQVTASRGTEQGTAVITMTNVVSAAQERVKEQQHWYTSRWAKIGYVAAAAAITTGIVLAKRNSGTTITGTPGLPTIGGPAQ